MKKAKVLYVLEKNYHEFINLNTMNENTNNMRGGNSFNTSSFHIPSHTELMKLLSKHLNIQYNEVFNGITVEQALVAKANIYTVQKGAFYRRDKSTNYTYFQLYFNLGERSQ
ncbi:hypothetical protein RFI_17006 [Reticulomyxa filosa]|uniref:Uncharacterized protein n=1 Tax=Reticulomyxa filosa TaxID=46433 RepID=X6N382_RETFI|nr:hypothetical protein RFI_17006 [Reticulomyxa filosa]|eukprot:ETO20209.1 hypothetical protein RFI_17006 [Reticulomyxa filosa]